MNNLEKILLVEGTFRNLTLKQQYEWAAALLNEKEKAVIKNELLIQENEQIIQQNKALQNRVDGLEMIMDQATIITRNDRQKPEEFTALELAKRYNIIANTKKKGAQVNIIVLFSYTLDNTDNKYYRTATSMSTGIALESIVYNLDFMKEVKDVLIPQLIAGDGKYQIGKSRKWSYIGELL